MYGRHRTDGCREVPHQEPGGEDLGASGTGAGSDATGGQESVTEEVDAKAESTSVGAWC